MRGDLCSSSHPRLLPLRGNSFFKRNPNPTEDEILDRARELAEGKYDVNF